MVCKSVTKSLQRILSNFFLSFFFIKVKYLVQSTTKRLVLKT